MTLMKCPSCKANTDDNLKYCSNCGFEILESDLKKSNNKKNTKKRDRIIVICGILLIVIMIIVDVAVVVASNLSKEMKYKSTEVDAKKVREPSEIELIEYKIEESLISSVNYDEEYSFHYFNQRPKKIKDGSYAADGYVNLISTNNGSTSYIYFSCICENFVKGCYCQLRR